MTESLDPSALMQELSVEFDIQSQERHEFGQKKYGAFSFLGKDMIEEAIYELLDMSNYARYQFIKLRMIQMYLANDPRIVGLADSEGNINIGIGSFKAGSPG